MESRFEKCCFDFDVIRSYTQCDRLNCEAKHSPVFTVYYHNVDNEYCYCLNREQLGQYWRCIVEDNASYVQLSVKNARFAKKRHIFLLSCRIVGIFIQILKFELVLKVSLINQLNGVFVELLIKKNLGLK